MTGALIAYRWELRKLAAEKRTWLGVLAAGLVPVIFVISIQISKITPGHGPYKTPLGPNLRHTGMAIDLVVLKLIASVGPTLVVALVAGDIVASEDMAGTLKTILVRSVSRGQISPARPSPCSSTSSRLSAPTRSLASRPGSSPGAFIR